MIDYEARAGLWHAVALCLIAGFVDAYGYFDLGHVFTANMTGNTVLLGVSLVKGDWIALNYLATIAAFAVGVVASTLLKIRKVALPAIFLAAAAVLAGISIAAPKDLTAQCALAFAMGLQGGAIATFSGIRLPTVVVTSTLVNLIDGLVRHGIDGGKAPAPSAAQLKHLAGAWLAYGLGGAGAVLAQQHVGRPLLLPAALYVLVALSLAGAKGR